MASSARPTSTDLLTRLVNQAAHGFGVGDVVRYNGATWVLAQADIPGNCHSIAMVSIVPDANSFYYSDTGFINNITATPVGGPPFVAGSQYFLSESTPGKLTTVQPSAIGEVIVACFVPQSATSGEFISAAGNIITPPPQIPWITVNGDTAMAINTGYWIDPASAAELNMTMPISMGTSDLVQIAAPAGLGFIILQNANQFIDFVQDQTTIGVAGSIELDVTGGQKAGSITINCHETDLGFMVTGSTGNFIVT